MYAPSKPLLTRDAVTGEELRFAPWSGSGPAQILADDHPLIAAHPDCFKRLDGMAVSRERFLAVSGPMRVVRSGTAKSAPTAATLPREPRGRESWRLLPAADACSISTHRSSGVRVRIDPAIRTAILDGIQRTTATDGKEWGAVLFGAASDELIEIVAMTDGPGPEGSGRGAATRTACSLAFNHSFVADAITFHEARGLVACSVVHTHPRHTDDQAGVTGSAAPSEADLAAFAGWRAMCRAQQFLAVIATDCVGQWQLSGWIIGPGLGGRDRCQPVRI
jgi:hypothetical protein